ncbi:NUDIX hydrolase [Glycomyces sp. A-F 0318]|uniref:NUDIX domain-containing protein n=1 Tax=Glycomyces amatae TaxID=2881355 RepID=UPI001E46E96C|nr:NUDIX hydrolase [Glycomyces amatae]
MNDAPEFEQSKNIGSAAHTRTIPTKRTAATVIFTDDLGRVLLCQPTYQEVAEAPGRAGEKDEPPADTAAREVKEELSLVIEPGRLVAVDYVPPSGTATRTEGIIFVFDGGRLTEAQTNAIVLDPTEFKSWWWCTVDEVHERMHPLVARRIEASLTAIVSGQTLYMENGYPVGTKPAE